jgi:Helix-turn-helix domain
MTAAPKFQSFNWMRGVTDDKRISIVHRLVLIRICLHRRNDDGQCSPGYDAVAAEVGVHRATVFRAVDAAVRSGWLAQPVRHGRAFGDFVFTFPVSFAAAKVAPVQPQEDPNVAPVQRQSRTGANTKSQRQRGSQASSTASTRNGSLNGRREREKSQTPHPPVAARGSKRSPAKKTPAARPKPKPELGDSFREFWGVYPRRVAKEAARKAHAAAIKRGADPETLIATAQRYAGERAGQDPRYTKHPATWLNGGCWEDEPPAGDVIDEAGNLVAYEQPQQQQSGFASIAEELNAAHVIDPKTGW